MCFVGGAESLAGFKTAKIYIYSIDLNSSEILQKESNYVEVLLLWPAGVGPTRFGSFGTDSFNSL